MPDLDGTWSWMPDAGDPRRYAEISHDASGIHLDDELARREGLPGVILHGMHVFGQVVSILDRESGGAPLSRVRVRFAGVAVPEATIDVTCADGGAGVTFTAQQRERQVLRAGWATFDDGRPEDA
ncbi:MAG: MaoC/PaaZ C-terminal domain-containing protein [Aeromicrobium sp.]|uniref:MaoC/PaaZ C-terminal domain-containing protein n=1 Tax=Aeromicrobium sp. TaxID=1871063 RepID=UPI002618400A|nr:MaoC/PaaZ C-terminal domain-containing protein [Aeromicrobium sp.]MDF1704923.1 MaoC/PaaZ C-terminal domain-containing protein [Aeromicrobium sp.]